LMLANARRNELACARAYVYALASSRVRARGDQCDVIGCLTEVSQRGPRVPLAPSASYASRVYVCVRVRVGAHGVSIVRVRVRASAWGLYRARTRTGRGACAGVSRRGVELPLAKGTIDTQVDTYLTTHVHPG